MELNCPFCSQPLRVRDGLRDPVCRCPSCHNTFRAAEYGYVGERTLERLQPAVLVEEPEPQNQYPEATPVPDPKDKQGGGMLAGKIGTILMLLFFGFKVSKLWRPKKPKRQPPVQQQRINADELRPRHKARKAPARPPDVAQPEPVVPAAPELANP